MNSIIRFCIAVFFKITRTYTREVESESVPTIYMNGIKVMDPFNVEEMLEMVNQR